MKIIIVEDTDEFSDVWTADSVCYLTTSCKDCRLNLTDLCDKRNIIIPALNITSFPYTLDTDDYPELLI